MNKTQKEGWMTGWWLSFFTFSINQKKSPKLGDLIKARGLESRDQRSNMRSTVEEFPVFGTGGASPFLCSHRQFITISTFINNNVCWTTSIMLHSIYFLFSFVSFFSEKYEIVTFSWAFVWFLTIIIYK